jgi:hypothetical protein
MIQKINIAANDTVQIEIIHRIVYL